MTVRRKRAERRDGIGCALAPVETGFDRSRFLLRRSDEDRFQPSGAEWTPEEDALLRSLIGSGKPPRAIALEMKRTVGGIRAMTAKLGLRNNRLGDTSAD
jgi:hypothetical protein